MESQKAISLLKSLPDKYPLDAEEKEAVISAIGALSWCALYRSRMKAQKDRKDKSAEW